MIFRDPLPEPDPLRARIRALHRADETTTVEALLKAATLPPETLDRIAERARAFVREVRDKRLGQGGIDAFMHEYQLSSREGVVLMCLAEALLRIPDAETADELIKDKLADADWEKHLGTSESLLVNASTWALMLTGRIMRFEAPEARDLGGMLKRLVVRSGEPVIRQAVTQAMRILGRQFVMGRDIGEAIDRAKRLEVRGFRYSYDMLGEAARTMNDADHYMQSYHSAIAAIGAASTDRGPIESPGISVKLSALHPRYEFAQRKRVMDELVPRLLELAQQAKSVGIGFTIDAEEADRLDVSLDVLDIVARDPSLKDWDGFGLALQGYQKRAPAVIDWLEALAQRAKRRLMVRLVKGAYWDTEIKFAQERGLDGYPVFTRKGSTDVSTSPAPGNCLPGGVPSIRSSQPTTRTRSRPFSSSQATAAISSSNGCTAWAMRSTKKLRRRRSSAARFESTRRSAATKICWRTWSVVCWKTVQTPRSSIASSMRTHRSTRSWPTRWRECAPQTSPIRGFRCRAICFSRSA
jgi:RHH-type proline utilization regulon transcriptional repressor/proline dehydrogenase/delta 1-pyrroline-5-carboxylate dehydrogenase